MTTSERGHYLPIHKFKCLKKVSCSSCVNCIYEIKIILYTWFKYSRNWARNIHLSSSFYSWGLYVICKELPLSETFYNLYFKRMILINIIFSLPAVYNDVEGRINAFRTMLQTKLLELPTPLEEQKKLIRSGLYLIISLMFLAQTQCHFWKSSQLPIVPV